MVRDQWILGGFCGFQVRTRRDHLSLRERWEGGGYKGRGLQMTRDHQYTAEYHDTTKILQSAPQPSTIYCLVVRCLRILGGFHGFQGGNSGDHHRRGGVWREGTLENWLQMRGDHQNTAEPCETTKILWLHPPAPSQAVNNNDQSLTKYFTALSSTLLSTVQKKKIIIN